MGDIPEKVERALERIDADKFNAFISSRGEKAISDAQKVQDSADNGDILLLEGCTIGVKSNINVIGSKITCASRTLEDYISPFDADVVHLLRENGAVIVGMTNMDEFACGSSGETSYFGPTLNPVAEGRIPGGSSSGSAVAVASGLCDMALGSDTGGSIRNPASHCGVVGIKPTYGRVSRFGLIDLSMSLEQIGPFAETVDEAAALLQCISGHSERDSTTSARSVGNYVEAAQNFQDRELRIGMSDDFKKIMLDERIYDAVRETTEAAVSEFDNLKLVEVSLPHVEKALDAYYLINYVEFFSATRKLNGVRYCKPIEEVAGPEVLARIKGGSLISQKEYTDAFYGRALKARAFISEAFSKAFGECDILVSPVTPKLPHKLGDQVEQEDMYRYDFLTVPANLSGICAGVVPGPVIEDTPVGIQIQANHFREEDLIRAMKAFESVNGYVKQEI